MSDFVIQIVARIVITGLLTLVIGLCVSQILPHVVRQDNRSESFLLS
jgi:hypothetical protein